MLRQVSVIRRRGEFPAAALCFPSRLAGKAGFASGGVFAYNADSN